MNLELALAVPAQATAEDVWQRWELLTQLRHHISEIAQAKGTQWRNAVESGATPEIENALYGEWQDLWREFRVISAWAEIMYAVWVFKTDGIGSSFLEDSNITTTDMRL